MESVGGLQARGTRLTGVMADLVSADREAGVLTVTIRFRNSTRARRPLPVEPDLRGVELEAGGRSWPILRDGDEAPSRVVLPDSLAPAETRVWRGEFTAPPLDVTEFDLAVPGVDPFTAVPIRDG
jgi:hypothetical protein